MPKKKKQIHGNNHINNNNLPKQSKTDLLLAEIADLEGRIEAESPDHGYAPPLHQKIAFRTLTLSECTLRGLEEGKKKFDTMTAIQNACIPHALAGRDVLGAARTGSGKTLAFLIPMLEKLFRLRYSADDGPGGIVMSPTRELAVQIFEVLRQVGAYHAFSAGLLVGGKKEFPLEQSRVGRTNILIATPGRLLQHLEQTPLFDCAGLQILVLDEADRILDMGFRDQLRRILEYLPPRQTLLFSATQTKKVSDLAALSLKKPEYLGVHDKEKTSTPESLLQSMVVIPLEHKLNALYSFLKSHLKCKIIVFMASCSQVRHAWELFCSLQPGIPVMCLHGRLAQERRTKIYFDYLQKPHAVLLATDVAARGLDFPSVDWVLQLDAPEDKAMYIHRVGRTARYNKGGKSLLCLLPSEIDSMSKILQEAKIPIKKVNINPSKTVLVTQRAASLVASNPKLNELAKKAFKSYVRSVHLMPNKDIFDVHALPLDDYATALGLASTPPTRFLEKVKDRSELRQKKNVNHKLNKLKEQIKAEKLAKKIKALGGALDRPSSALAKKRKASSEEEQEEENEQEDDLLIVKKTIKAESEGERLLDIELDHVTKSRHAKKIRIDVASGDGNNKHVVFDDDGNEENVADAKLVAATNTSVENLEAANEEYMRKVRERLAATVDIDRATEKERIREKHRKKRTQEKGEKEVTTTEAMATLASVASTRSSEEESIDEKNESENSSSSSSSSAGEEKIDNDSDDDDDDDSDGDSDVDVAAQEDMALAMIRNRR